MSRYEVRLPLIPYKADRAVKRLISPIATFEQDILDVHCRHIVFCGSTDNGYARILGPHQGSNRISLVQGAPFAWEMEQLASEFQTTSFPEVFRSTRLPSRASSFSARSTASANSSPCSSPTRAKNNSSLSTSPTTSTHDYATIAKSNLQASSSKRSRKSKISVITFDISPSYDTQAQFNSVQLNSRSQRVDPPLRPSSYKNMIKLRNSKFCNRYHILGECAPDNECSHQHGCRLSDHDALDLRCISRTNVCPNDIYCTDEKCISGHQCPWEHQNGHIIENCKFPRDMHGVDRTVAIIL